MGADEGEPALVTADGGEFQPLLVLIDHLRRQSLYRPLVDVHETRVATVIRGEEALLIMGESVEKFTSLISLNEAAHSSIRLLKVKLVQLIALLVPPKQRTISLWQVGLG